MLSRIIKSLFALTPYRVVRGAPNRFDAIGDSLRHLRRLSYEPRVVIDGGAHLGLFSQLARKTYPDAAIHMIEPQPACHAALEALADARGFTLHKVALDEKAGSAELVFGHMADTGAHVGGPVHANERTVTIKTATLDELFSPLAIAASHRTLLKLDTQGHELRALKGAARVLPLIEMVITEVSFFQQVDEPSIPDLIRFFDERCFDLFDVAALAGRTRDGRLRQGDLIFVRRNSPLWMDKRWE